MKKDSWRGDDFGLDAFMRIPENHWEVAHSAALIHEQYPHLRRTVTMIIATA